MDTELEQILDDEYLDDLTNWDVPELRAARTRCQRVETSLSYLRRLAQGRADIVQAELDRRTGGGDPEDLDDLVARLPDVLSEGSRPAHVGPMPQHLAPGRIEGALAEELADMEVEAHLSELSEVPTDWLERTGDRLVDYERRVSDLRRSLFERIDALGSELARRYREGAADIDAIIGGH